MRHWYTFSVMTTVGVIAEDEDEAFGKLVSDGSGIDNRLIDMDIELVDTEHSGGVRCDCPYPNHDGKPEYGGY